jgi:hypothetical protein
LLFLTQIAGARLRTGQHDLAITCFYARSDAISSIASNKEVKDKEEVTKDEE